ncbi:MAG: hypothetical protein M3Z05_18520 [Gemmatimonadota bacterium]|nr:hypothetical protein [Gemmatimonadota bacterium]
MPRSSPTATLSSRARPELTHLDMNRIAEYDWNGKEVWSLVVQSPWGAVRLDNGNTLFTTGKGIVREVNPRGETVWEFTQKDAPDIKLFSLQEASRLANGNTVISNWCPNGIKDPKDWTTSVQVLEVTPDKHVVWALRSWDEPANLMLINTATNVLEKELPLPTPKPDAPHLQFRRVRVTRDSTYLAAHLDDNRVSEYDQSGKQIWSFTTYKPWSAVRLDNGNTLMTSAPTSIVEVDKTGQVVWEFSQKNVPEIQLFQLQEVSRLTNGNTLVTNWCPANGRDPKDWPGTVQVLEITPDKRVVWALSQWKDPDLGPFSSIQLLDVRPFR